MASPSAIGDLQQNPENEEQNRKSITVLLEELKGDLKNQSPLIFIQGRSGMGKTTLAKKLFQDEEIKNDFAVRAWVSINQNFQIKLVLQSLLQQLRPEKRADIKNMNDIEMIGEIFSALENKKYLLVLDDMGAVEEWQTIRLAVPISESSKVIITTSSEEEIKITTSSEEVDGVAEQTEAPVHKIPGLIKSDILAIVEEASTFNRDSDVAEAISKIAGGSPLLAIILGKSLQAVAETLSEQELVKDLLSYIPYKGTPKVLKACYERLTDKLQSCLLYLGLFPHGQDIEVEKLHMMLSAENLIKQSEESKEAQQSERDELGKLVGKQLVEVQDDIASGKHKSCRLPDQVHEFCKSMGSDKDFFNIVDFESDKEVGPNTERLVIHFSKYRDHKSIPLSSQEILKKIQSLLIFDTFESDQKSTWPSQMNDLKEFNRLSVLSFDGVDFRVRKCPKGIDKLKLLRYLSFRGCCLEELSFSLSKLTNLETLDLLVRENCKMSIPSNILTNMKKMVHLYLPSLYRSDGKPKLQLQALERLETLVNFDPQACEVASPSKLNNLTVLKVISEGIEDLYPFFKQLVDNKEGSSTMPQLHVDIKKFDRYKKDSVSNLKKLLESQFLHSIRVEGQIGKLSVDGSHGLHVAEIVLNGSEIEHDPMNVLRSFHKLRSLVLTNDALVTSDIVMSAASPFPNLRSLKLRGLRHVKKLTIEQGAAPELCNLEIESCPLLQDKSIPDDVQNRIKKAQGDWS